MDPIEPRLRRSHFVRLAILGVLFSVVGLPLLVFGRKQFGNLHLFGAVPIVMGLFIFGREHLRSARRLDETGATRRDGRRFEWKDLKATKYVHMRLHGQIGPLNHIDFIFPGGRVRILPFTLENAGEVLRFAERFKDGPPAARPPAPPAPVSSTPSEPSAAAKQPGPVAAVAGPRKCSICGEIGDYHRGFQKGGREEEDTFLPAGSSWLKVVAETRPGQNRTPVVKQCPECGAWFLYEVEYDFLVGGSEDTQTLSRITPEEAAKLIKGEG